MKKLCPIFFFMVLCIPIQARAYTQKECIKCHTGESSGSGLKISIETYNDSPHGSIISCLDCHAGIKDTTHEETEGSGFVDCGCCHGEGKPGKSTGFFTFLSSLKIRSHKKQDFSRSYEKTNCLGCHQGQAAHGEKEPVNRDNCYICHMKMKDSMLTGYFHVQDNTTKPVVRISAMIYKAVIIIFLLGILGYIIKKTPGKLKRQGK